MLEKVEVTLVQNRVISVAVGKIVIMEQPHTEGSGLMSEQRVCPKCGEPTLEIRDGIADCLSNDCNYAERGIDATDLANLRKEIERLESETKRLKRFAKLIMLKIARGD